MKGQANLIKNVLIQIMNPASTLNLGTTDLSPRFQFLKNFVFRISLEVFESDSSTYSRPLMNRLNSPESKDSCAPPTRSGCSISKDIRYAWIVSERGRTTLSRESEKSKLLKVQWKEWNNDVQLS